MPPERDDDTLDPSLVDVDVGLVLIEKDKNKATTVKSSNGNKTNNDVLHTTGKEYTIDEVAKHNGDNTNESSSTTWIIYNNLVLDVTSWLHHHPGGEQTIARFGGMDATDEIRAFHDDWIINTKLTNFVIGTVVVAGDAAASSELVQDFRTLGETFDSLGYFTNSKYYYIKKLISVFTLFALSLGLLLFGTTSRTTTTGLHTVMAAILMGLFWQQFAFIGHDCGHMYSARTHAKAGINIHYLGALVTFFNGISVAWWKATHNIHHAVPNTVDCDPDIAHLPVFAVSSKMFNSLFNLYHGRVMPFDWPARNIFVPYQHLWYYPIMCVARFNLYIQSIIFLLTSKNDGHKGRTRLDTLAFVGFFTWLIVLVSFIPTWGERVTFVMISHAVAGLLNVQITLSHFSRPIFDSPVTGENEGQEVAVDENNNNSKMKYGGDFYTRNVISSLDVDCPVYLDWFHGGLQFQTLHHLYPRLGREHLRKTLPLIRSLCKKHNLPYTMKSFIDCNIEIYETLRHTGLEARTWSPLIYESLCAQG